MEHNLADAALHSGTSDSFDKPYIRLRTVLDALEANALHYILKDKNYGVRSKRTQEVEALIMPILKLIGGAPNSEHGGASAFLSEGSPDPVSGECPEGFYNCGGCCVPYQCP